MLSRREVKGGENAATQRNQVRSELDGYRRLRGEGQFLFDFGQVPVLRNAVRTRAFVAFHEEIVLFQFSARAADAAERVSDDAGRPDQALAQQGNGRQQNARRITAGRRDERRVLDLRAINFRETVNRLLEQVRRGMVARVKFFVNGGVLHAE